MDFETVKPGLRADVAHDESEQAWIRLALVAVFSCYLLLESTFGQNLDSVRPLIPVMLTYLGVAGGFIYGTRRWPEPLHWRRVLALIIDQGLCAVMIWRSGEVFAPFLCVPVWIAIGSGMRYGSLYLYLGTTIGAVFNVVALGSSAFWQAIPHVAIGVVIAIIFVPIYSQLLLHRLENAKQNWQLRAARFEMAARTDPLTGLLNRRAFQQELEELLTEPSPRGISGAVMIVDLDGFKGVNDIAGHSAGDEFLRRTADCLRQSIRGDDLVARLGGDEFAVLLRGVGNATIAQRIGDAIVSGIISISTSVLTECKVGASIGVLLLPDERVGSPEDALLIADALMYEVKRNGKGACRLSRHAGIVGVVSR